MTGKRISKRSKLKKAHLNKKKNSRKPGINDGVVENSSNDSVDEDVQEAEKAIILTQEELSRDMKMFDNLSSIFKYLSLQEVTKVSQVCRSWNLAAENEVAKRAYIQVLLLALIPWSRDYEKVRNLREEMTDEQLTFMRLQLLLESPEDLEGCDEICSSLLPKDPMYRPIMDENYLKKYLKIIPELTLIFSTSTIEMKSWTHPLKVPQEIAKNYCDKLPPGKQVFLIDGDAIYFNTKPLYSRQNVGVSLFFPQSQNLNIETFTLTLDPRYNNKVNWKPNLYENLMPVDDNSCFLFFNDNDMEGSGVGMREMKRISKYLKQNFKEKKLTVFGGNVNWIHSCTYRNVFKPSCFCIRLSGSCLESYAMFMDIDDVINPTKLMKLKKNIKINKHSVAFALVYDYCPEDSDDEEEDEPPMLDKTRAFRDMFPDIPLISLCVCGNDDGMFYHSSDGDSQKIYQHEEVEVGLLVLTYN